MCAVLKKFSEKERGYIFLHGSYSYLVLLFLVDSGEILNTGGSPGEQKKNGLPFAAGSRACGVVRFASLLN